MSNVSKISVALTSEMADLVERAVDSGEYASGSEVIREALREWKTRRETRDELRRLWDAGLESGPGGFRDVAAIKREAQRRQRARASKQTR